jgi:hypothetical protein
MEGTRRTFSAAAVATAYLDWTCQTPGAAVCRNQNSMQVEETVSDDDLTWIKQMGVNYLNIQTGTGRATLENSVAIKRTSRGRRVEGLEQYDNRNMRRSRLICRDETGRLNGSNSTSGDTGKAGVGYITYAHMANGIWLHRDGKADEHPGGCRFPGQSHRRPCARNGGFPASCVVLQYGVHSRAPQFGAGLEKV